MKKRQFVIVLQDFKTKWIIFFITRYISFKALLIVIVRAVTADWNRLQNICCIYLHPWSNVPLMLPAAQKSKISLPYIMGTFVFAYFTWDCWRFVVEVDLNCVTDDSFWKEKSIHQSHRLPLKRQLGILRSFKVAPNCRWYHSPSWRSSCSTCSSSPLSPPTWRQGWPGGARPPRRPSSPRRRASSSPRPPRPTAPAWPPLTATPTISSPTELGK